jgi:acyl-CoA thioesterase
MTVGTAIEVDRSWWSAAGVHGGRLAALGLASLRAEAGGDRPARSVTTHYLAPVGDGPLTFDVEPERIGRSNSVASYVAVQNGRKVLAGSAVFGATRTGPGEAGRPLPAVLSPGESEVFVPPVELATYAQYLELRLATPDRPLGAGDRAEIVAWIRFADRRPLGAEEVVLLTDALPPALYALWDKPKPIPTVDLTVHLTDALDAGPVGGWALTRIRAEFAGSGWAIDDSTVWSEDGRLLGLGRQTRRVLPGRD